MLLAGKTIVNIFTCDSCDRVRQEEKNRRQSAGGFTNSLHVYDVPDDRKRVTHSIAQLYTPVQSLGFGRAVMKFTISSVQCTEIDVR